MSLIAGVFSRVPFCIMHGGSLPWNTVKPVRNPAANTHAKSCKFFQFSREEHLFKNPAPDTPSHSFVLIHPWLPLNAGASGKGFLARDMTFMNTAGPANHQAVAFRLSGDMSALFRCSFVGYQDTLYVHSQRQFFRECDIYGTVDFIFGNAAVVLQKCNIYPRRPMANQKNTITAQNRKDPNQNTGISIHDCRVVPATDLAPVTGSIPTFLGRPWKLYARVVYMQTFMDGFIHPAGWLQWSGDFALKTLYYGEYMNSGPGAALARRVTWPGFHVITQQEATQFTVGQFISGMLWLPGTGIAYLAGLVL